MTRDRQLSNLVGVAVFLRAGTAALAGDRGPSGLVRGAPVTCAGDRLCLRAALP